MKKLFSAFAITSLLAYSIPVSADQPQASHRPVSYNTEKVGKYTSRKESVRFVKNQVLVKFKVSKISLTTSRGASALRSLAVQKNVEILQTLRTINVALLASKTRSTEILIKEFNLDPSIESVQPNYQYYPRSSDPDFNKLWGLNNTGQTVNGISGTSDADIDAPEAWGISRGNDSVVAVIDSGVAYNHPDLVNNLWDGSSCLDSNGNPLGGCNYGYDFEDNDKTPLPTNSSHGTHVAGIIAAQLDNSIGVAGVAPHAKIMALKTSLTTDEIIQAIQFAHANGARIINASWGGVVDYDPALKSAIDSFEGLFITAAGNSSENHDVVKSNYPCDYDSQNIICVAATDQNDNLTIFSDYGSQSVDVGAPGVNILSAVPSISDTNQIDETFEGVAQWAIPASWTQTGFWGVFDMSPWWGSVWGKVLYGDLHYPYLNNADTTITTPAINLGGATASLLDFWTACDTEYTTVDWRDYMSLEISNGGPYTELLRWDEAYIDSNLDPSGSAVNHFSDISIPSEFLTSAFKLRYRWVTNSYDNNYDGCALDDIHLTKRIVSDGSDEQYEFNDGTSMATPFVAGETAYIWSLQSSLTSEQVKEIVLTSGDSLSSLSGKTLSGTRINLLGALKELSRAKVSGAPANPTKLTIVDVTVGGYDVISYKASADGGVYSPETLISNHFILSGFSEGVHNIKVIGKDSLDNWQSESEATEYFWRIDTTAPTASITYSIAELTNQDVIATLNPSEPVTVTNNNGLTTRTFTDNGNFSFEFIDAAGNSGAIAATVNNIDKTKPIISLVGTTPVNITQGDTYTDAGAAASDDHDGDITSRIVVVSPVNTSIVGAYTITYNVTDFAGNFAEQIARIVNVNTPPPPPPTPEVLIPALAPIPQVLGAEIFRPIVNTIKNTKGAYSFKVGTKKITLKPFGTAYRGSIWAKKVDFGSDVGVVYLFANTGGYRKGAVKAYDNNGKLLGVYKPFGGFATNGFVLSIAVDINDNVFLVVATPKAGTTARIYKVTKGGLTIVNSVKAVKVGGQMVVRFSKIYKNDYALLTYLKGKKSTLKIWKYNSATKKFIEDKSYNKKSIKI